MKSILLKARVAFDAASLDWLQDAGHKVHGHAFDARETLFTGFKGIYSALRLYHGTRIEDPALFTVTGILPSNIVGLNKRAVQLFGESPELREIIKELRWYTEHNVDRIWVSLDPCQCLKYEYCWRGSEYLSGIANRLEMAEKIKNCGTPTLLEFDVSVEEVGDDQVNRIAKRAIGALYENWDRPGSIKAPVPFDFELLKPVLPEQIRKIRQFRERPATL
ncbi:MAG TPA: hypothetical protein VGY91_10010 [Chthoniobacterales bacterium]|jgi:hypothetical protein|nr:hypothetical protein [Chthoniobacterales bacterium]